MSNELETRLEEAFAVQAATTTTSDDAWARIQRRSAGRDHRRSVVLRSVAAAVVAVLAVGGGVALFRDRGGSGTVATGSSDASKSVAEDSAGSSAAERPEANGLPPGAQGGDQLEIAHDGGFLRVRLSDGSNSIGPNYPGGMSAAVDGGRIFGVVPADATTVRLTDYFDEGIVLALVETFEDPRAPEARFFIIDGVPDRRFVRIEARSDTGLEVRKGTIDLEAG